MPLPEFTLHDFNKIASGEYNAGQIDFVTGDNGRVSLAKINNHVHKTGLNKTTLSAARQTRFLFFRDLFEHLEKKGWFR